MDQAKLKSLFDYQDGRLINKTQRNARALIGSEAGCVTGKGYRHVKVDGTYYQTHRLVWLWFHGHWPEGQLDHIDQDRSNNSIDNLREVSHLDNHKNQKTPKNNTSGHVGVYARGSKWQVTIANKYYGVFADKLSAVNKAKEVYSSLGYHTNHGGIT